MYLKGRDNSQTKYASVAEKLKVQGITVEVLDMKGTCHGYETALKSSIVEKCISRRVEWIRNFI